MLEPDLPLISRRNQLLEGFSRVWTSVDLQIFFHMDETSLESKLGSSPRMYPLTSNSSSVHHRLTEALFTFGSPSAQVLPGLLMQVSYCSALLGEHFDRTKLDSRKLLIALYIYMTTLNLDHLDLLISEKSSLN